MPHAVDPKLDVVFKLLFAHPANRNLLVSLLTAVLSPPKPIVDVTVLNPELPKELVDDKGAWLDVRVRLEDGRQVDVEMQSYFKRDLRQRALYYWARLHASQARRGDLHSDLKASISIFLLAFRGLPGSRFHSKFRVLEVNDHSAFSDDLELHVLELPKLAELSGGLDDEPDLGRWGRFMAAESDEERKELAMQDPVMKEAKDALDRLSEDPEVQELAERRRISLAFYQHDVQAAREEGRTEGKAEGRTEGEAIGRTETLRNAVEALCTVLAVEFDDARRQVLGGMSEPELKSLFDTLTRERRWPTR